MGRTNKHWASNRDYRKRKKWGYFIEHLDYPEIPFQLENLSFESLTKLYQLFVDRREFGISGLKERLKKLTDK